MAREVEHGEVSCGGKQGVKVSEEAVALDTGGVGGPRLTLKIDLSVLVSSQQWDQGGDVVDATDEVAELIVGIYPNQQRPFHFRRSCLRPSPGRSPRRRWARST